SSTSSGRGRTSSGRRTRNSCGSSRPPRRAGRRSLKRRGGGSTRSRGRSTTRASPRGPCCRRSRRRGNWPKTRCRRTSTRWSAAVGRVAYHAVAEEIANILLADPTLAARAVRVVVDEGNALGPELCPFVNVRPARRDLPVALQPIAAHTVARFLVTYTMECWDLSLYGMVLASRISD